MSRQVIRVDYCLATCNCITLVLINDGDASDGEDIDEWYWGSVSENDLDDDQYWTTSDSDELVTVAYLADSLTTPVNYVVMIVIIILH